MKLPTLFETDEAVEKAKAYSLRLLSNRAYTKKEICEMPNRYLSPEYPSEYPAKQTPSSTYKRNGFWCDFLADVLKSSPLSSPQMFGRISHRASLCMPVRAAQPNKNGTQPQPTQYRREDPIPGKVPARS